MSQFIEALKALSFWRFIVLFVFLAIVISEILIIAQSYLLHGEIHQDLLIIGFITLIFQWGFHKKVSGSEILDR